ncbi:MAG: hypothetical protein ACFFCX_05045 [Candidatus Sifarchaeia archaeon]
MNNKNLGMLVYIVLFILILTQPVNADPPKSSDFVAEYDFDGQELTVTSTHSFWYSSPTNYHFISWIRVYRVENSSDVLVEEREYPPLTTPTDVADFSDTFQVTAVVGDSLRAMIWFNTSLGDIWLPITKTIIVEDITTTSPTTTTTSSPTTTPSSQDNTTLLLVAGVGGAAVVIILVAVILRRR